MISRIILFLVFILISSFTIAQETETSFSPLFKVDDFKDIKILGKAGNNTVILMNNSEKQRIIVIDSTLQKSKELYFRFTSKIEPLEVYVENDTIYSLFFQKHKHLASLKFVRIDQNLKIIDTTTIYTEKFNYFFDSYSSFTQLGSPKVCLFRVDDSKKLDILGVSKTKLKTTDTATVQLLNYSTENTEMHGEINNDGEIFIAVARNYNGLSQTKTQWQIFKVGDKKRKSYDILIKDKINSSGEIKYDPIQEKLVIAGYYSIKSPEVSNGVYRIQIDFDSEEQDITFDAFTKETASEATGKKNYKKQYIANLVTRELVLRSDGGIIVIGEYEKIGSGPTDLSMTGAALRTRYNYSIQNILISSFDSTLNEEWNQTIFKKQYSQADLAIFSSYFLVHSRSELSLLVNDEVTSKNTISKYSLSPLGSMKRTHFVPDAMDNPNLAFRHAYQSSFEVIYVLDYIKGRKFRLVRMRV